MSDSETTLRRLMARHGLTQVAVAAAAGISQPFLSSLVSGSSSPSLEVAIRLVRTLREMTGEALSVESLFAGSSCPDCSAERKAG